MEVALASPRALPPAEVERLLRQAHALVFAKLPKRTQERLNKQASRPAKKKMGAALRRPLAR